MIGQIKGRSIGRWQKRRRRKWKRERMQKRKKKKSGAEANSLEKLHVFILIELCFHCRGIFGLENLLQQFSLHVILFL